MPKAVPLYDVLSLPDIARNRRAAKAIHCKRQYQSMNVQKLGFDQMTMSLISVRCHKMHQKVFMAGNGSTPYTALEETGIQKQGELIKAHPRKTCSYRQ